MGRALSMSAALILVGCGLGLHAGLSADPGPPAARAPADDQSPPPGPLVAVGGGGTTDAILARTLELAGGPEARVVVLAQASQLEDAGQGSAEMWREAGAREATNLDLSDRAAARRAIEEADLIWMPGGSQNRLLDALVEAELVDAIRARHAQGAVVGGTSAGAAVLSELMMTGEADLTRIAAGTTELVAGLAVWKGAIIDQHVLRRQRLNRTISAVLDHPGLVGVAVDERTAAILIGTRVEVVGDRNVVLIDARGASVPASEPGTPAAGTGLGLHVLRSGMSYELAREAPRSGSDF